MGGTQVSGPRPLPSLWSHALWGGRGTPSPVTGPVQSPVPGQGRGYPPPDRRVSYATPPAVRLLRSRRRAFLVNLLFSELNIAIRETTIGSEATRDYQYLRNYHTDSISDYPLSRPHTPVDHHNL